MVAWLGDHRGRASAHSIHRLTAIDKWRVTSHVIIIIIIIIIKRTITVLVIIITIIKRTITVLVIIIIIIINTVYDEVVYERKITPVNFALENKQRKYI